MVNDAKIRLKLAKLLAMSDHPNSNPEEAANAAARAAEMSVRYNIDLASCRGADVKEVAFTNGGVAIKVSDRDRKASLALTHGVGQLFACVNTVRSMGSSAYITFYGQEHNIGLASHWASYLWDSCKKANREFNKQGGRVLDPAKRASSDVTFRIFFCSAVAMRLLNKLAEMKASGVTASAGEGSSTALVVANWHDTEMKAVRLWIEGEVEAKPAKSRPINSVNGAAARAGDAAGAVINIDTQVGATSSQAKAIT